MDLTRVPKQKRAFTPFNAASERFPSRASSAGAPGYCFTSTHLLIVCVALWIVSDRVVTNAM